MPYNKLEMTYLFHEVIVVLFKDMDMDMHSELIEC